ncbi:MAG: DNA polymerase III subunit beta [Patescibacteria group bacterium]
MEKAINSVPVPVDTKELKRAISRVLPCVSRDDYRLIFQYVLFESKNGLLTLVAADGFRMAYATLKVALPDGEWVVHHTDVRELRTLLKIGQKADLRINQGELVVDIKGTTLFLTRGNELKYVNWRAYLPASFGTDGTEIIFSTQAMKKALKEIRQKYPWHVKLEVAEGKIKLRCKNEKGDFEEAVIPADVKGSPIKIALDGVYLRQMVNAFSKEVLLKIDHPYHPALFQKDNASWVVMSAYVDW